MTARIAMLAALLACGCAARHHVAPPPLDAYADAGPLAVRGARRSDPGPAVVRALAEDAAAGRVLAARGEPETVEVVRMRGRGRRVVLTYPAPGGKRRRVVLESGVETRRAPPAARRPARVPGRQAAIAEPPRAPTSRQQLECPIDPDRPECRALCAPGATHEWCGGGRAGVSGSSSPARR
jgi:hypothetical protein